MFLSAHTKHNKQNTYKTNTSERNTNKPQHKGAVYLPLSTLYIVQWLFHHCLI